MKHDAIVDQGIPIHERVPIPDEMIPADSRVEIDAKIQAGYFTTGNVMSMEELANVKGRGWEDIDVRRLLINPIGMTKLTVNVALNKPHDTARDMQGKGTASSDLFVRQWDFAGCLDALHGLYMQFSCAMHDRVTTFKIASFRTHAPIMFDLRISNTMMNSGCMDFLMNPSSRSPHQASVIAVEALI